MVDKTTDDRRTDAENTQIAADPEEFTEESLATALEDHGVVGPYLEKVERRHGLVSWDFDVVTMSVEDLEPLEDLGLEVAKIGAGSDKIESASGERTYAGVVLMLNVVEPAEEPEVDRGEGVRTDGGEDLEADPEPATAEEFRALEAGDRLRVRYDSSYSPRGDLKTVEATVAEAVEKLPNIEDKSVLEVRVVTDDRDTHESEYSQPEADRRLTVIIMGGSVGMVDLEARNCGRWHSIVRVGQDAEVAVLEEAEAEESTQIGEDGGEEEPREFDRTEAREYQSEHWREDLGILDSLLEGRRQAHDSSVHDTRHGVEGYDLYLYGRYLFDRHGEELLDHGFVIIGAKREDVRKGDFRLKVRRRREPTDAERDLVASDHYLNQSEDTDDSDEGDVDRGDGLATDGGEDLDTCGECGVPILRERVGEDTNLYVYESTGFGQANRVKIRFCGLECSATYQDTSVVTLTSRQSKLRDFAREEWDREMRWGRWDSEKAAEEREAEREAERPRVMADGGEEEPRRCYREGCEEPARERSSYCSTACYEADTGTTPAEILDPNADPHGEDLEPDGGVAAGGDSYSLLEAVRSLEVGDRVRVTYQIGRFGEREWVDTQVTDTSGGSYPLVDLTYLAAEGPEGVLALEYDEHYSEGSPYNLRQLTGPQARRDGASVVGLEPLDLVDREEDGEEDLATDGGRP